MAYYRAAIQGVDSMEGIDWSKPLERVSDGAPVTLSQNILENPSVFGVYYLECEGSDYPMLVDVDGIAVTADAKIGPLVRNSAPPSCFGTLFYFGCERCRFESTCKSIAEMKHAKMHPEPDEVDDTKTLRDEFAMAALQFLGQRNGIPMFHPTDVGAHAYAIADAMMQERAK